ncbi:MAG: hypothetical protein DHS20C05_25510 [Hyphococcus sp.]|nr:MAG: hypothetical protein DHS20C05_25510 [Marinicaulis sp.]
MQNSQHKRFQNLRLFGEIPDILPQSETVRKIRAAHQNIQKKYADLQSAHRHIDEDPTLTEAAKVIHKANVSTRVLESIQSSLADVKHNSGLVHHKNSIALAQAFAPKEVGREIRNQAIRDSLLKLDRSERDRTIRSALVHEEYETLAAIGDAPAICSGANPLAYRQAREALERRHNSEAYEENEKIANGLAVLDQAANNMMVEVENFTDFMGAESAKEAALRSREAQEKLNEE